MEQKLNGNQRVNIKEGKTGTFDDFAQAQQSEWKANTDHIVKELENRLDGKQAVKIQKLHTKSENAQIQKEYDRMAVNKQPSMIDTNAEETKTTPVNIKQEHNISGGLNSLPESFNMIERILNQNYIRSHQVPGEKVTEFPKLWRTKEEEKAGRKEASRLIEEHKDRRINEFSTKVGNYDAELALSQSILIQPEDKYSFNKYSAMIRERGPIDNWTVDMTREEFMRNKPQYVQDEFERAKNEMIRKTRSHSHRHSHKKETFWDKIKNKLGL